MEKMDPSGRGSARRAVRSYHRRGGFERALLRLLRG